MLQSFTRIEKKVTNELLPLSSVNTNTFLPVLFSSAPAHLVWHAQCPPSWSNKVVMAFLFPHSEAQCNLLLLWKLMRNRRLKSDWLIVFTFDFQWCWCWEVPSENRNVTNRVRYIVGSITSSSKTLVNWI